jgi:hypothetical protein
MNDLVLAAGGWLESRSWAAAIRASALAYPLLQWMHFAGLSLWLGACLAVDLRLLGVGRRRLTAAALSSGLSAWKWIGFGVAVIGGFLLFSAYATMYLANSAFVLKVAVLTPLAVLWHLIVHKQAGAWNDAQQTPAAGRWAGGLELVLWISVVIAAVGFLLTNVS